ncbi:MAG: hypothetical protein KDB27_33090 [Planctomycetales bacterium]|nr:hypothetical protein [Planctomycetales bacterium]
MENRLGRLPDGSPVVRTPSSGHGGDSGTTREGMQLCVVLSRDEKTLRIWREFATLAHMGTWGITAIENDAAWNWLDELFDVIQFAHRVELMLRRDVHECPDEVRAAACVASTLMAANLWPSETKERTKDLATHQLRRMLDEKVFANAVIVAEIRKEVQRLESARAR